MRGRAFLAGIALLSFLASCSGGGSGGGQGTIPPSFSASPTTLHVSGTTQSQAPPASILLTVSGTIPSTGIYYGWENSSNMISNVYDQQPGDNQIQLNILFGGSWGKPVGTYQDTIKVIMALDPDGKDLISGSPQVIQVIYDLLNPPASLYTANPASVWAGGPDFRLTLTGDGFPANAQVQWNGTPLATTWVSSTTLQAQVPASAIAQAGDASITVGGQDLQTSAALYYPVANARALVLEGGWSCAWDQAHGVLYTNRLNHLGGGLGPAIQGIDPSTGMVMAQVACGSESSPFISGPMNFAVSDDGSYLYVFAYNVEVGVPGTILRYLLPSLELDPTFSIPLNTGSSNWVTGMAVAPGAPHTLAVALGNSGNAAGVEIFDDGSPRGSIILTPATPLELNSLAWGADASTLYVLSGTWNQTYQLSTVAVGPGGPAVQATQSLGLSGYHTDIHWVPSTGYIYSGSGQVFDPATGNVVATCASGLPFAMDTDLSMGLGFYLTQPPTLPSQSTGGVEVASYDLTTFEPRASTFVPVGRISPIASLPAPTRILRCGASTLVLYGGTNYLNPIFILTGPFAQGQ